MGARVSGSASLIGRRWPRLPSGGWGALLEGGLGLKVKERGDQKADSMRTSVYSGASWFYGTSQDLPDLFQTVEPMTTSTQVGG